MQRMVGIRAKVEVFPRAMLRRLRDDRGTAMVEFALLATVLLLIVVGILYFGRFLSYTNDETHLAEVAARAATVGQMPPNCSSFTTLAACVQSEAPGELRTGSTDVSSPAKVCIALGAGATSPGQVGDPVVATVTATYHFLPLLGFLNPLPAVTESATMRLEQPPSTGIIGCSP
jgi:Flp pilus assembly protein TadG